MATKPRHLFSIRRHYIRHCDTAGAEILPGSSSPYATLPSPSDLQHIRGIIPTKKRAPAVLVDWRNPSGYGQSVTRESSVPEGGGGG